MVCTLRGLLLAGTMDFLLIEMLVQITHMSHNYTFL